MSETQSVCISCLETDNLFNIFDNHECEGIEEIYAEMLKLCFDLSIPRVSAINHMCIKCILTLRQAYYFKQTIIKNVEDLETDTTVRIQVEYLDELQSNCESQDVIEQELNPETGQMTFLVKNDNLTVVDNKNVYNIEYENYDVLENAKENHEYVISNKTIKKNNLLEITNKESSMRDENVQLENYVDDGNNDTEKDPFKLSQYKCGHCEKMFVSKIAIDRHMKTHLDGPFSCHICGQEFSKMNSRNSHLWRVHRARDSAYACAHCGQRFPTFHQRLAHLRDEHDQQPEYPCPFCDNVYFYAGARSTHIRSTHLQVHRHSCTHCKMAFFKRRSLLSHMASIHGIGEKKHKCPICNKSFYRNTVLKHHMKTHREKTLMDKKYQCHICPAQFTYNELLRNHIKCHEMESQTQSEYYIVVQEGGL